MIHLTRHHVECQSVTQPYHYGNDRGRRRKLATCYRHAVINNETGRVVTTRTRWIDAMFAARAIEHPTTTTATELEQQLTNITPEQLAKLRMLLSKQS